MMSLTAELLLLIILSLFGIIAIMVGTVVIIMLTLPDYLYTFRLGCFKFTKSNEPQLLFINENQFINNCSYKRV